MTIATTYDERMALIKKAAEHLNRKKMLDAIAFAEGTTGSYGTLYGGRVIDELAAGEMTIAEVLKMQKSKMYKGKETIYKRTRIFSFW